MKKSFFICLVLLIAMQVFSQNKPTIMSSGALPPVKLIERDVKDTAFITVFYKFACAPDSTNPGRRDEGQTILLMGDKWLGFMDWNTFQNDSVNDNFAINKRNPWNLIGIISNNSPTFWTSLVINKQTNDCIIQIHNFRKYQYSQQLPHMDWQLLEGDKKEVCGVICDKAICHWSGRDWEAWYSTTYPAPYGPYLFNGLPGLIFALKDTKNNFFFKLNGLDDSPWGRPIYIRTEEQIVKTTREKVRTAIENAMGDINAAVLATHPRTILPKEVQGKKIRAPYNPIEKE